MVKELSPFSSVRGCGLAESLSEACDPCQAASLIATISAGSRTFSLPCTCMTRGSNRLDVSPSCGLVSFSQDTFTLFLYQTLFHTTPPFVCVFFFFFWLYHAACEILVL